MTALLLLGVFALHVLTVFWLFHRGLNDLLRFYLPAALAFACYQLALAQRLRGRTPMPLILLLSAVATFLSFWSGMVLALNTYGS
jgi:hypothetical protein